MIDYPARTRLCEAIDDYLNDRLSAFDFDQRLTDIQQATADRTVHFVAHEVWCCYDDCKDHSVVLDKASWNAIQRLQLLLLSGQEIQVERQRFWHFSQCIAFVTLAAFGYVCSIDWRFWPLAALPGGVISIALSKWRERFHRSHEVTDPLHAWPFASPMSIARAYRRMVDFRKQRFRPELAARQIRTNSEGRFVWLQMVSGWLTHSPFVLLYQTLPITITRALVLDRDLHERIPM